MATWETVCGMVQPLLENEERLLTALSPSKRRRLAELLRKLLRSEPFGALDPAREPGATASGRRIGGGAG